MRSPSTACRVIALAGPLLRHTGGNPLFVLETLKQGLTDGSLARGELPRPLSVGALIERRLQRLSEPALTLARVAAIAGVDFSIELAEAAIGVRAVQLASAWAELAGRAGAARRELRARPGQRRGRCAACRRWWRGACMANAHNG